MSNTDSKDQAQQWDSVGLPAKPQAPSVTVLTVANVGLTPTWEAFVQVALSEVFPRRKGPIPAVSHTRGQNGRWDVVGRERFVHLDDGSIVREEITASDPHDGMPPSEDGARFAYRVSGFSGPIGFLAKEARGAWRFEQIGTERTRIEWQYTFVPKSWLRSLPLHLLLRTFWRSYMMDGIQNVRMIAERPLKSTAHASDR